MGNHESVTGEHDGGQAMDSRQGHYFKLALFCLAVALSVVVIVVLLTVPDDSGSPLVEEEEPAEKTVFPAASVTLATTPLEISNEQLQVKLLEEVEALQTRFPRTPQALHVAAGTYAKIHQTTKAGDVWKKCIELAPRHVGPRLGLATLMSEKGEDAKAIEMLEMAFADGCSSAELYYRLATAQSKMGEVEEAEAVIKAGVKAFPTIAVNWLLLGQTQNQLQKFEEAEQNLLRSVKLGNESSEVYFALANSCQRQGKGEQAAEYRKRFSELKAEKTKSNEDRPFQEIYQQALRPIVVGSFASAAAICVEHGDMEQGERLFLRANTLEPDNRQVLEELATFYRNQARFADARIVQERLVELRPTNAIYHVNLASLASQLGDWKGAESALEEAKELRPDFALPYMGLAQLKMQLGDFQQARKYAESSVRCEPTIQGFALLAIICQQQGDLEAANAARQAAGRLASANPQSVE